MARTFIALEIPIDQEYMNILDSFKKEVSGISVKWVEPQQLHITLAFLGETSSVHVKAIVDGLQLISGKYKSFSLNFNRLGVFKNGSHPKVIWLGLNENSELLRLAMEIRQFLDNLGFDVADNDFVPHLTLGRVKNSTPQNNLQNLIQKYNTMVKAEFWSEKIIFYESILTNSGPIYKPIKIFQIKA
jgi:RNA 2',3'-cyclic 3'-phosphodiesterase